MGPQLYRCGNQSLIDGLETPHTLLQWGRNFIVAEMPILAAMGLGGLSLQWGRNFIVAEIRGFKTRSFEAVLASMGPQLYRCGNQEIAKDQDIIKALLQWGRNFIVAEIGMTKKFTCKGCKLQWGRNFIVAEIYQFLFRTYRNLSASMGPQLYRCGNPYGQPTGTSHTSRFNGAATLSLRK